MVTLLTPLVAVALVSAGSSTPATDSFSLRVEILSAMEAGPLVVKVALCYRGTKPMDTRRWYPPSSPLSILLPREWDDRRRHRMMTWSRTGLWQEGSYDRWQPGESRSKVYYLHHFYERIPAGPAHLRVEWPIYAPDKIIVRGGKKQVLQGILLAKPVTTIAVTVPRATPENIRALRRQLERELAACSRLPEGSEVWNNPQFEQTKHLTRTLIDCPHEALFPLVPKLIALPDSKLLLRPLIDHVYNASASPQKVHALFRDYLLGPDPVNATAIFEYWEDLQRIAPMMWRSLPRPQTLAVAPMRFLLTPRSALVCLDDFITDYKSYRRLLPKSEVQRLKQARNVWVRALTWVTFPHRCDRRWVEGLMLDLARLNRPLSAAEFQRLLGQLDSPRFAVRERAAAELLRVGDGVAPALRDALKRPLELELRRRIERLLADIDRGVPDPLRRETLAYLASRHTPEARAVLQTLAGGLPQARLTKAAAAALEPPKEYHPEPTGTPGQPRLPIGVKLPPGLQPPKDKPLPSKEGR